MIKGDGTLILDKIKRNINRLSADTFFSRVRRGQSLVEIAISMPILIFLLIGVFEVGSALRSYLVLVNVNREITRFAVRPGYLDFSTEETTGGSFQRVREWADASNTGQLDLDFDDTTGSTTLIISHVVVDTGLPCEDINDGDCNSCEDFLDPSFDDPFPMDNIIVHPGLEGMEYQAQSFGPDATSTGERPTRIKYDVLVEELTRKNNHFNCEVLKRGGVPSANNVIVTELYHDQPQLFGFPLISNPFTDPVPLYTHTVMRLLGGTRGISTETVGDLCMAYPFTIHEDELIGAGIGATQLDILGGPNTGSASQGNRGFLAWDPQDNSKEALEYEVQFPQMSINGYRNPGGESGDITLNKYDWVASLQGNNGGINSPPDQFYVDQLAGKEIIIPVYDKLESLSNSNPPPQTLDAYHIVDFIKVEIIEGSVDLTGYDPEIKAVYKGPAPEACTGGS
ncbi:MAG TPA: pilus assembly protein [Anaerolineae bacterium]|nr:pilus assembly protein [Anaerolineae bacterium]